MPLLDDETTKEETTLDPVPEKSGELVRVCELCNTKNKSNARKCANPDCGEEISDIIPVALSTLANTYELTSQDGRFRLAITDAIHTIGREDEGSEYLTTKTFVGRKHAEITMRGGLVYLTDLSSTNGTFLNGKQLGKGTSVLLNDGDEIWLGGTRNADNYQDKAAYFYFRKDE